MITATAMRVKGLHRRHTLSVVFVATCSISSVVHAQPAATGTAGTEAATTTPPSAAIPPVEASGGGAGDPGRTADPPVTPPTNTTSSANAQGVKPAPPPANLDARTVPIIDIHGAMRTRYELFNNFGLGWEMNAPGSGSAGSTPMTAIDQNYAAGNIPWPRSPELSALWCGPQGATGAWTAAANLCTNGTQTSANMRLRLNPEIHPAEFLAIHTQIDLLDNLVLGSTPEGFGIRNQPGTGWTNSPWAPISAWSNTQITPTYGMNALISSIAVKRAWGEATSQTLGQIRFGRMPWHWGLGLYANAGNGPDSDYQTTVDRIMYSARIRSLGLFVTAMWDFPNSGPTSQNSVNQPGQGQPIDLAMGDNVWQWVASVGRRLDPEQARAAMSRGEVVVNAGLFFAYRTQWVSADSLTTSWLGGAPTPATGNPLDTLGGGQIGMSYNRRQANIFVPDVWLQVLGTNFRIDGEAVFVGGTVPNVQTTSAATGSGQADNALMLQFGFALDGEYRLLNNRLKLQLGMGYASGDPEMEGMNYYDGNLRQKNGNSVYSLFRFHPDYRIDLIFWRQIMKQFAGAYYLRPSVQYNFIDEARGDLFFGRVDAIWSRASEFVQTRGNHADLGIEFDGTLQYQSNHHREDGVETKYAPGFYATLQYGIFIPMGGVGPTDFEKATNGTYTRFQLQTAQTARITLGLMF